MSGPSVVEYSSGRSLAEGASRLPRVQGLLRRLRPDVAASFSGEQRGALAEALDESLWTEPPLNIRLGFPLIGRRYYLAIVAGVERRGPDRRARDRVRYPLRTMGNVFFSLGLATLAYITGLVLIAFYSAILE